MSPLQAGDADIYARADAGKIAQDAYAKGKDAINKYIELGNDGLGLNFTPIDQMD